MNSDIKPDFENLIVGKRYWLDTCKDISGVYMGQNSRGDYTFNDLVNNYSYLLEDDGSVAFKNNTDFFLHEDEPLLSTVKRLQEQNEQLKEALKTLRDEAYDLREHCQDRGYLDFNDPETEGCDNMNRAIDKATELLKQLEY